MCAATSGCRTQQSSTAAAVNSRGSTAGRRASAPVATPMRSRNLRPVASGTCGSVERMSPGRYAMHAALMSNSTCCTTCQWSAAVMRREVDTAAQKGARRHGRWGRAGAPFGGGEGVPGRALARVPVAVADSSWKVAEAAHACWKRLASAGALAADVSGWLTVAVKRHCRSRGAGRPGGREGKSTCSASNREAVHGSSAAS